MICPECHTPNPDQAESCADTAFSNSTNMADCWVVGAASLTDLTSFCPLVSWPNETDSVVLVLEILPSPTTSAERSALK